LKVVFGTAGAIVSDIERDADQISDGQKMAGVFKA